MSDKYSWPIERHSHATCCLGFGTKHPQLLVTGGVGKGNKTLKDAWLFDISNRNWKEVRAWEDSNNSRVGS